ncbi:hypothetical protein A1507_13025 [Methylomonas koyamae]|uniref:Uncharacterized protein n=1 Tax=Methylomonas koyamae TaxID=702114 RepID=A0A177NE89_9GAMM|nr:WYL domain-containing protein [Methylomonas koyamae]OAI15743.1 hypothetical protein A1507_13025 [Methylomonas koyamae]BBL60826.1 hypothetical protein MKFW12EY_44390 [Methylomonas koyamae]
MDSLLRYFDMLSMIPKAPNSISTPDLLSKLVDAGYEVDIRTVQRDLVKLSVSRLFPISSTADTKPLRWQWPSNTKRVQLPTMTSNEALSFKLVEMFLEPLLPPSIKSLLADYFEAADRVLAVSPLAGWVDKVRQIPSSLTLQPPEIDATVLAVVYEALLKDLRMKATYHAIERDAKTYEVNPLGLVFRHNVIYLVATINDYIDIKQLALHRFIDAELTDKAVNIPGGFSLNNYIEQGEFDYPTNDIDQTIPITFKISAFMKQLLLETPISSDQQISILDDDRYLLHATVKNTEQLRWWIRSFSTNIEVLEPPALRAEMATEARALIKLYR